MTTPIDSFYRKECEKIDPECVNAYFEFEVDDEDNKILILHTSWGDIKIDLTKVVEAAETVTHMKLSPDSAPEYLDYQNERGVHECIGGDNLSKIISLSKLKDVSPSTWQNGYAPVWDANDNIFKPYNVQGSAGGLETRVTALEGRMSNAEVSVTTLTNQVATLTDEVADLSDSINTLSSRISALDTLLTRPTGIPSSANVVWGNANMYTQTDKSTGAYTHNPATTATGDRTINSDVS